jgi:hypothetical protein
MTRYSYHARQPFPAAVGARESPGQRPVLPDLPESGLPEPQSPTGQRTDPQNTSSRGPPQRIRRKAQPETEGIETVELRRFPNLTFVRRKA